MMQIQMISYNYQIQMFISNFQIAYAFLNKTN